MCVRKYIHLTPQHRYDDDSPRTSSLFPQATAMSLRGAIAGNIDPLRGCCLGENGQIQGRG